MKRALVVFAFLIFASTARAQTDIEPTFKALGTVAFGSVTASFTSFFANTAALFDLDIVNLTNADITCSFDSGTTSHVVIPAYSSYSPELGRGKAYLDNPVYCKYTTAAPTVGNVYFTGEY